MSYSTHLESLHLQIHEGALLEIGQNVGTLFRSLDRSVGFQTVDRCHFQLTALVILLEVDHRCGQIREGRTEERSQRHPAGAKSRLMTNCIQWETVARMEYFKRPIKTNGDVTSFQKCKNCLLIFQARNNSQGVSITL